MSDHNLPSPPPPPQIDALGESKKSSPVLLGAAVCFGLIILAGGAYGVYKMAYGLSHLADLKAELETARGSSTTPPPPVEPPPPPPEAPLQPSAPNTSAPASVPVPAQPATVDAAPQREPAAAKPVANPTGTNDPAVIKFVYDAIQRGRIDSIRAALDQGYSPDQGGSYDPVKSPKTQTMLCLSIQSYRYDISELLLERGANPNLPCSYMLPIHRALENGTYGLAEQLIKHGADPNQRDEYGNSLLERFIANVGTVDFLLTHGADPNILSTGKYPSSPLSKAVQYHNIPVIKRLLQAGANPDLPGEWRTARTVAEYYRRTEVLELFK